jgi:hypothetical protein
VEPDTFGTQRCMQQQRPSTLYERAAQIGTLTNDSFTPQRYTSGRNEVRRSGCASAEAGRRGRIDLQSEIEAEHASTRIQQRETRGTFRTVNPRQRKQVRNNNPQSADNQRPTAHTQGNASETTTQHTTPNTKLLRVHCGHRGTYACGRIDR